MKKNHFLSLFSYAGWNKFLLIMRISIILLAMGLQLNASIYSQSLKFDLNIKNQSLRDVFKEIENKSKFHFFFGDNLLLLDKVVDANFENSNVEQILDKLLANSEYSYKVLENNLVVIAPSNFINRQDKKVTGKITDAITGEPLPGVSILIESTTIGTITDGLGNYSIDIPNGAAVLIFSYVGYLSERVAVENKTVIDLKLSPDIQSLDEVVVVGYGTSKVKDLTSPVVTVKSENINKHATTSPMQALQGQVAGMQIINNGIPGSNPTVRVRGVGSFGDENPLYVVDGMFFNDINFLNNSDIEDITVLKDASAASIYGVRAANGVVLVTTKRGKLKQKAVVTYNGYMGVQRATNVLKMANSAQYAAMQLGKGTATDTARIVTSINRFGGSNLMPAVSTDWYKALLRSARIQSHSMDITGGTEKASYSFGVNYLFQEGILEAKNEYERFNLHAQTDYHVMDWLKIGANVLLTNSTQYVPNPATWNYAFISPPTYPVYDENNTTATPVKFGSPSTIGYSEYFANPVASAYYYNNRNKVFQVLPTFYLELNLLPKNKLVFKSSYNQNIALINNRNFNTIYNVGGNQTKTISDLAKSSSLNRNYILDNILTFKDQIGNHHFSAMAGSSVRSEKRDSVRIYATNVPTDKDEGLYINQGNSASRVGSDDGKEDHGASFFGRVTYDFAGKYLLSATMRADGTSKYQQKWGYFPSVGLGWILTEEDFMKNNFFDFLKLRASWGKLGTDKGPANDGFASVTQTLQTSGIFNNTSVAGFTNNSYYSRMSWEVVEEVNTGFDFTLLKRKLSGTFDYYSRLTKNAIINAPLPMGAGNLRRNLGEISNSGIEIGLRWNDEIGADLTYTAGVNMATLKNEVKSLNGVPYIYGNSAEFRTISRVGDAINSFYGHEVTGVYQNAAQVAADPIAVANGLHPGDFIYKDQNSDGKITDDDRVILGSYLPKMTLGADIGVTYKKLDFGIVLQGQFGNKIANQKRGLRRWQGEINYDVDMIDNRWTGDGSTNKYPSAAGTVNPWNIAKFNSFLVEDGSYITIQNVQLGYTIGIKRGPSVRLCLTAERPYTFFKYNGFSPEVANGFDLQTYPLSAVYSFGVKITY